MSISPLASRGILTSFVSPPGSFADFRTISPAGKLYGRVSHPCKEGGHAQLRKPLAAVALEQLDAAAHAVPVHDNVGEARPGSAAEDGPDGRPHVRRAQGVTGCRVHVGELQLVNGLGAALFRDVRVRIREHVDGEIGILKEPGGSSQELIVVARNLADLLQQGSLGRFGGVGQGP